MTHGPWAVAAVWCLACGSAQAETVDVFVFDFDFSIYPPELPPTDAVIRLGDTVRWVWLDDHHNTVACAGQIEVWQSDLFETGDVFEHTFTNPGVFWYYCAPHGIDNGDGTAEGMAGTITVVPGVGPGVSWCVGAVGALARRRRR